MFDGFAERYDIKLGNINIDTCASFFDGGHVECVGVRVV